MASSVDKRLPVTLLSGFLGAGKTTLLKHILTNKEHGLRCAVIVNDMASLNVDAETIAKHGITEADDSQVYQMQNGCICCSLRVDLLKQVDELTQSGKYDYLIIESSGISDPEEIAETFAAELEDDDEEGLDEEDKEEEDPKLKELLAKGGLPKIARLDTCVTVVDCVNALAEFETIDFLSDRPVEKNGSADEDDERTITDLLVGQIEFADVILLNKTDVAPKENVARVRALVAALNPRAKIYETDHSIIEPKSILNTGLFNFEEAQKGAGWMKAIEKAEACDANCNGCDDCSTSNSGYNVASFVYRRRRPFHPGRLMDLIGDKFAIMQALDDDDEDWEDDEEAEDEEVEGKGKGKATEEKKEEKKKEKEDEEEDIDPQVILEKKKADPIFGPLLRSKGFFWLATRTAVGGEWSQAGAMLTATPGDVWYEEPPKGEWEKDAALAARIRDQIFQAPYGDRRQEIVFIGGGAQPFKHAELEKALDAALLNDDEWAKWEATFKDEKLSVLEKDEKLAEEFGGDDGFNSWIEPFLMAQLAAEDDEEDAE